MGANRLLFIKKAKIRELLTGGEREGVPKRSEYVPLH